MGVGGKGLASWRPKPELRVLLRTKVEGGGWQAQLAPAQVFSFSIIAMWGQMVLGWRFQGGVLCLTALPCPWPLYSRHLSHLSASQIVSRHCSKFPGRQVIQQTELNSKEGTWHPVLRSTM